MATAFRYAHKNMDFIQLSMKEVPGHLRSALQLMTEGTCEEISDGLPIDIGQIVKVGNSCKEKVKEVIDKYDLVINELNELTEATIATQGVTEEARRRTRAMMEANRVEQEYLDSQLGKVETELEKTKQQLEEETSTFKKAVGELGSWQSSLRQILNVTIDTAANTVVPMMVMSGGISMVASAATTVESIAGVAGIVGVQALRARQQSSAASPQTAPEQTPAGPEDQSLAGRAQGLAKIVQVLKETAFVSDIALDKMALKNKGPLITAASSLDVQKTRIASAEGSNLKEKLMKVCSRIEKLIADVESAFDKNDSNVIDLHNECEKILEKCIKYGDAKTKASLWSCPSPAMLNNAKGFADKFLGPKSNLSENYVKEVHMKMELTKEQLRSTEKDAEMQRERQLKLTKDLHQTLSDLTKFKEENSTQDEVLKQIAKGLEVFGKLKKQWTDLLVFFDGMGNLVNATLGPRLDQFAAIAQTAETQRKKEKELTTLMRQRLFTPAYEATKIAYIVDHLSTTYWKISQQHLMPIVSSFGEMIAMSDKKEIEAKQRAIQLKASEAAEQIEAFIEQGHRDFEARVQERQRQLEITFKKFVPQLPEEEVKKIQEFVQKAKHDDDDDDHHDDDVQGAAGPDYDGYSY